MAYIAKVSGSDVVELRVGVLSDIAAADQGNWRPVVETGHQTADPYAEVRYISALNVNGSDVQMVWGKVALPEPYVRMRLKEYAAAVRWAKTQGGVTLPGGMVIDTSEASKTKIDQALALLEKGWAMTLNWKTRNNWLTLDLATMTAIAQAVAAHEQACFDAEQAVTSAIDAGTVSTKAGVDAYPWP